MLNPFYYKQNTLWVEDVSIAEIVKAVGTPCYIYSHAHMTERWNEFNDAFGNHPHRICYAVKANSNIAVLNALSELGSGFDIVSAGEAHRVLKGNGTFDKIIFSGMGKSDEEIQFALESAFFCINVESEDELSRLNSIAQRLNIKAPIALRVNPNVDAKSHPYISTGLKESKFGIDIEEAFNLYLQAKDLPHLMPIGIACHIGSQLTTMEPFMEAFAALIKLCNRLETHGIFLNHIDVGGGLGIPYQQETPPTPAEYVQALLTLCPSDKTLIIEPGRAIIGQAGILVSKVISLKKSGDKNFCVIDSAMNDLLRPTLYQAWQNIIPLNNASEVAAHYYDIVGPICESGDFLGKNRALQVKPGDYIAICNAGAYGFVMSSNYNSRPRPAEVMVKDKAYKIVRKRETLDDLTALETKW